MSPGETEGEAGEHQDIEVEFLSDREMNKNTKKDLKKHIRQLQKALKEGGAIKVRAPDREGRPPEGDLRVVQFDNAVVNLSSMNEVQGFLLNNRLVKSADIV